MKQVKALLSRLTAKRWGDSGDAAAAMPASVFDPFQQDFIDNPYPQLARLRAQTPICQSVQGSWVLTRYQDIAEVLADQRFSNTPSPYAVVSPRNREKYLCAEIANNTVPFLDPPVHTAPRRTLTRAFHEQLNDRPPDIQGIARELLASLKDRSEVDLLREFITPLSVTVTAELLGLQRAQLNNQLIQQLKKWSDWFFYLFSIIPSESVLAQLNQQLQDCRAFFRDLIDGKRNHQDSDLLSRLLTGFAADDQLLDTCLLLMADGVNADYGIANALLTLFSNPVQLAELRRDPSLLPGAAHELLRFDSPSLFIARRTLEDVVMGGQLIRKNTGVLLMLAAANRDPAVFSEPDRLDFSRPKNLLMSFGRSAHACVGRSLVLTMLQQTIAVLLDETDKIEFLESPQWELRAGHRWLKGLPVRIHYTNG